MLSISHYDSAYVADCRSRMERQIRTFRQVNAECATPGMREFEENTFLNMVLALDALFGHRARGQEGKTGNALNEVRMICGSLLQRSDHLLPDTTIRYDPARAVLGLTLGSRLVITAEGFERLANQFLDEIIANYTSATTQ